MAKALIIAHRGASQQAPENTIPAINKALELGADMIALEVQRTRDDHPVILADVSLDRTTNGSGRVARMTLAEVKALDAGTWFGDGFAETRVPTLQEALDAIGTKARVLLQLPETRAGSPWAARLLEALGTRKQPDGDVLVFNESQSLKDVRDGAKTFQYALTLGEKVDGWIYIEKAEKMGLRVIRPFRPQIDSVLVGQAHSKKMQVYAHFANEERDMRELLDLRVDGIVTGRPDRLKAVLAAQ